MDKGTCTLPTSPRSKQIAIVDKYMSTTIQFLENARNSLKLKTQLPMKLFLYLNMVVPTNNMTNSTNKKMTVRMLQARKEVCPPTQLVQVVEVRSRQADMILSGQGQGGSTYEKKLMVTTSRWSMSEMNLAGMRSSSEASIPMCKFEMEGDYIYQN